MKSIGQIFIFSILKPFTKLLFLTFFPLFSCVGLFGQFNETFEDNDLTQNPLWAGLTNDFSVGSGVLRLHAPPATGASYIATQSVLISGITWIIRVTMEFNPSSSNYTRIYLVSDQEDLNGALSGYFVMIGNSADEVSLYRQDGSTKTRIIDGADRRLDSDRVEVTIKVTRSDAGDWALFSRTATDDDFVSEGFITDSGYTSSLFAGIQCVYTSTRADKFSFDDFSVLADGDSTSPRVENLEVISGHELRLSFSEEIEKESGETVLNYAVDHAVGHPQSAMVSENRTQVTLTFETEFDSETLTIRVSNILDAASNAMDDQEITFSYIPPVKAFYKDVIVTEIMADPSPPYGLPEAEFIEIFNRSDQALNLSGWSISDGKGVGIFPETVLNPAEFAIVTLLSAEDKFLDYGKVIAVGSFPSLNNPGDQIILRNAEGLVVDSLFFSDSWYKDSEKKSGGFTLEIIDPENICGVENNWVASVDDSGGTPGRINSVDAENPDLHGPQVLQAYAIPPDTIRLVFSEKLSRELPGNDNISIQPHRNIRRLTTSPPLRELNIVIDPPFKPGEPLEITLSGIYDCAGNLLQETSRKLMVFLPEPADSLDVIINEVLFNPSPTGVDFVELRNASDKYISLEGWAFANIEDGFIVNARPVSQALLVVPPGDHLAFTVDPPVLLSEYPNAPEKKLYVSDLPTLNDDEGSIALLDPSGRIFDAFAYSKDMHSVFLKDTEGVSLERISPSNSAAVATNWISASKQSGYATPGLPNSNSNPSVNSGDDSVLINPEVFRPESGNPSFAQIEYKFDNPGLIGSVSVFDQQGRQIKKITEGELLGASGFFRWDGDRDDGSKAAIGPYILCFETFNGEGAVQNIRKRIVIVGDF